MINRRDFLQALGTLPAAVQLYGLAPGELKYRKLGRTGRMVVPFALGGQASLQWTGPNIDPADIIVRVVELGVNYLDTANGYGTSQANYGEAFRRLNLVPGAPNYNSSLRERLYLATKTTRRYALDRSGSGLTAVDELKRSLTTIFGDGKGAIPEGAYLNAIQIHNLQTMEQVQQIWENFERRGEKGVDRLGALAGLLDYRDGTNVTGLNPERRRWVRHIGVTGHLASPVLMNAIQRDKEKILDTLLVALNANDRRYLCHQHNVIPLAKARDMGIIAMKVFADGVFYGKQPRFSRTPEDVILTVGQPGKAAPADLVRYPLSIPGVTCAIVGIGHIDRKEPQADQALANLAASQGDMASPAEMRRIAEQVAALHGTETNYFQEKFRGLVQPAEVRVERDDTRIIVRWNTALAGAEPIESYQIFAGDTLVSTVPYQPQTTLEPLSATVPAAKIGDAPVRVVAVEAPGNRPRG